MFKLIICTIIIIIPKYLCQEKLDIDIFYESLCPDSLSFIKYQLLPAWKDIKDYVNLNLVPFGKSTSFSGGTQFDCQHGSRECEGNRVMSCALNSIQEPSLQVKFVNCYMDVFFKNARRNRLEFGQSCVSQAGLQWDYDIRSCYESKLGTTLQLNAEKHTKIFNPSFIPTIVYNKEFKQLLQDESLYNFRAVACSLIKQQHLQAC